MNQDKFLSVVYKIVILIALTIIADFAVFGTVFNEDIVDVKKNREQYYNAAKNHHHSYKVITNTNEFSVSEDFASSPWEDQKIEYSVSRVFKEVNWYKLHTAQSKSFYSLRIASGLILPLLTLLAMFLAPRIKKDITIPVFVLQVLLIADLIFLIQ